MNQRQPTPISPLHTQAAEAALRVVAKYCPVYVSQVPISEVARAIADFGYGPGEPTMHQDRIKLIRDVIARTVNGESVDPQEYGLALLACDEAATAAKPNANHLLQREATA